MLHNEVVFFKRIKVLTVEYLENDTLNKKLEENKKKYFNLLI